MILNVKGKYKIEQENHIIYEGENIITRLGESFLLNRCINDDFNPMQYIVIGNGDTVPLKKDEKLTNELKRLTAQTTANLDEVCVDLKASFSASEIIGITEIGVANDKILISHDVFPEIQSDSLVNPIGTVEITYTFQFNTSTIREGWSKVPSSKLYRIYEPSNILTVYENTIDNALLYEKTTHNGYTYVKTLDECERTPNTYYYNINTQVLYVHTSDGNHPNTVGVIIQTR